MSFTGKIAIKLKKYPKIKRFVKNLYQTAGSILSDKTTSPVDIKCESDIRYENIFGYYDKSPWNNDGTKMIYLRVKNANVFADSSESAEIVLKDLSSNTERIIRKTNSWNVQQGCMLQWLGSDFSSKIIYNDFRDDNLCSIIFDTDSGKEKIIDNPIYSVSQNGLFAISLDFLRLHTLRPGYGYCNLPDKTNRIMYPEGGCIFYVDLTTNETRTIITYKELITINPLKTMENAIHKVNHIMLNPSGNRFIFMHRWILNGVKYDRLLSSDIDGNNIRILLDYDMVSHCNWRNDNEIIAFANYKDKGYHYYSLMDSNDIKCRLIPNMPDIDGHPSFSPDGRYILTDTYPSFKRKQFIYLYDINDKTCIELASVYSNIRFMNETRCDLHPRWKRDGTEICFDGAQMKKRQVYTLKITKGEKI